MCVGKCIYMPVYSIWLIGITIVLMLIAIVCLSLALYLKIKNKRIITINNQNNVLVKETSTRRTQYSCSDSEEKNESCYEVYNEDDASTFTATGGSEPVPTTRADDTKIILARKPFRPMSPIIQRGQMDEICKAVLKRVQKSDSASFRDLNALLISKNDEKVEPKTEFLKELDKKFMNGSPNSINKKLEIKEEATHSESKEVKNEIKPNTQDDKEDSAKDIMKESESNNNKQDQKPDSSESSIDTTVQIYANNIDDVNLKADHAIKIEVQNVSGDVFEASGPESEYDTVPSPVRCRSSADLCDDSLVDNIPIYDLPPRRSYDGHTKNTIHLDSGTHYLIPISAVKTDSCYINAKTPSKENYEFKRSASEESPSTYSGTNLQNN